MMMTATAAAAAALSAEEPTTSWKAPGEIRTSTHTASSGEGEQLPPNSRVDRTPRQYWRPNIDESMPSTELLSCGTSDFDVNPGDSSQTQQQKHGGRGPVLLNRNPSTATIPGLGDEDEDEEDNNNNNNNSSSSKHSLLLVLAQFRPKLCLPTRRGELQA
mmetsp:Transcript_24215/g.40326  ORF Transcript_24215/g.40326 Transcript_24215/m.40326 type:complete len:160 (+) Transcript_24215:334-813(+)